MMRRRPLLLVCAFLAFFLSLFLQGYTAHAQCRSRYVRPSPQSAPLFVPAPYPDIRIHHYTPGHPYAQLVPTPHYPVFQWRHTIWGWRLVRIN
jgi:hypothetical protein